MSATTQYGNDGGPAFPGNPSKDIYTHLGMSLRDYFAAKAMPWVASDLPVCEDFSKQVAEFSYKMADAMLKARQA